MAGTKIVGCSHIDSVVDIKSSATPLAALHKILAVAGATTIKSILKEKSTCSNPPLGFAGNRFVITLLFDNAAKVATPINCSAACYNIT